MKLVASLIVHNEVDRYLRECVAALRDFCDEVAIWDDGSTDKPGQAVGRLKGVRVHRAPESAFYNHEGDARWHALQWAAQEGATHILAIDADELVLDGAGLREKLEHSGVVWSLCMREVWRAREHLLEIRQDGGWCEHPRPMVFQVAGRSLKLHNRKLGCGRVPAWCDTVRPVFTDIPVYHFGWACQADRQARWERYQVHDGGKYHRSSHLDSILWPDMDVVSTIDNVTVPRSWLDRANLGVG